MPSLDCLLGELNVAGTTAVALLGSHARGDAGAASDIDLYLFDEEPSPCRLLHWQGRLISLTGTTVAAQRAELARPERAIWAVPGLRQARIMRDPRGELAGLIAEAERFTWGPLRETAAAFAADHLAGLTEEVHKIRSGLNRGDEGCLAYATLGLALGLTEAVAVARGVMIESENTYFRQVQAAAGQASAWTHYHRAVLGMTPGAPLARDRALAALGLYRETAGLLRGSFLPEHLAVIEPALLLVGREHGCSVPEEDEAVGGESA